MQPTMKLRWVKRKMKVDPAFNVCYGHPTETVLQQWWEGSSMGTINLGWGDTPIGTTKGEWRDVPIETD